MAGNDGSWCQWVPGSGPGAYQERMRAIGPSTPGETGPGDRPTSACRRPRRSGGTGRVQGRGHRLTGVDEAIGLSPRAVRTVRAVAASTVATLVALASHLAAGGTPPPLLLVVAVCVLAWLPGLVLIGRRPSIAGQAAVIVVAEGALHLVFTVAAEPAAGTLVPRAGAAMAGMPGMAETPGAMPAMTMPTAP